MKLNHIACLSLALLTIAGTLEAQQTTPPANAPATTPTTPTRAQNLQPVQPAPSNSVYDYHETFGPPCISKNGNDFRAADGAPGAKYWQNRAD
jgi:hypothetical protein